MSKFQKESNDSRSSKLKKVYELGALWNKYKNNGTRGILLLLIGVSLFASFYPPLQAWLLSHIYFISAIALAMLYLLFDAFSSPSDNRIESSFLARHFSDLKPHLQKAFSQDVIEIDIGAYSGETFYNVLTEFLQGILDGLYTPRRLHLRIIVPDCAAPMAVPCTVLDLQEHPDYKKSIQERNKRFANEFAHYFSDISKRFPKIDVSLSIKMHKFSPLFKMIKINSQVVFIGFYPIAKTPVNVSGEQIEVWDYRGERTLMVGLPVKGNSSYSELAREIMEWYHSVWANLSEKVVEI